MKSYTLIQGGNMAYDGAELQWGARGAAISKRYIIKGLLQHRERKEQKSLDLPLPSLNPDTHVSDSNALINSIFGQTRNFNGSFIIMDRDDDYSDGTGAADGYPLDYSANEQKEFILDIIFKSVGYHVLRDTSGNEFNGRITSLEIVQDGDDPVKYDCTFTFKRGVVALADQLPFS
jgi:hypothetical protein